MAGGVALAPSLTRAADAAAVSVAEGPKVLRTPEARFGTCPTTRSAALRRDQLGDGSGTRLRVHYVDERPSDPAKASGETILLLHGNPSWSYLYRHVIPPLVAAGHRCVALDLVGFGRSDKPTDRFVYTYANHVGWLREAVFDRLGLRDVTLVCHDWGGLLGLLLLAQHPDRFRRVVASNTRLGWRARPRPGLGTCRQVAAVHPADRTLRPGQVVDDYSLTELAPAVRAAYDAPFPGDEFLHGVRRFAVLIPITEQDESNPMIEDAGQCWKPADPVPVCVQRR